MKAFKTCIALLVTAVLVTAGAAAAGENRPFHEDELYQSEKTMSVSPEQTVGSGPLFQDRYENFLYKAEKVMAGRYAEAKDRFYAIQPSWDGLE